MIKYDDMLRLFSKVIDPQDPNKCYLWIGSTVPKGYGVISINNRQTYVHRVSYQYYYKEDPTGMYVCHTCDTPNCVNPKHLFLGTALDNNTDMYEKGRNNQPKGNSAPTAILYEVQVIQILEDSMTGKYSSIAEIARKHLVKFMAISAIFHNRSWKHITKDYDLPTLLQNITGSNTKCGAVLTEDEVRDIKRRIKNSESVNSIYQSYQHKIERSVIYNIRSGKSWQNISL